MKKTSMFFLSFLCLFSIISAYQAFCQSTRDILFQSIEERARQDAQSGRASASPQDLNLLFGKDADRENVTLIEVMSIYEKSYSASKSSPDWWEPLLPKLGWITAIILFFLVIFRDALTATFSPHLKKLGDKIYNKVAAYSIFQRENLKRYRKALIQNNRLFKIPFRANRFLDMEKIYIPLKMKGSNDTDQVESFDVVTNYHRLMVIGAPGSGKSLFLKSRALFYATTELNDADKRPVPILLNLSRLNKEDKPLVEHLVDMLNLHNFPDAKNFVETSLNQGSLILLFDGLDEVNSQKRTDEVNKIKDLLNRFKDCPALITCRTAVYRNEFDDVVEQTFEIVEFSDQQIQSFLASWPDIPPNKSIDQLLYSLTERPRIMALARNPLLLTIIAFLYTDVEEFELPRSRTEFYSQAAEVLFKLRIELNKYSPPQKQLVMEHLALFNQKKGAQNQADRLSIDLVTIIDEIKKVIPNLNLDIKDAEPLLEEIVERSGLLLKIDGGTRYQFSHLTLQEFFSATALRSKASELLDYFKADPDPWRETVKLWCGLAHDSTNLIKDIFDIHPVTAFECLADAQMIDMTVADEIITYFKDQFVQGDFSDKALIKVSADVASGSSQRSQAVFRFLTDILKDAPSYSHRVAAVNALSLTNKPAAAQTLSEHYTTVPEVHPALKRLGNLAVPVLESLAQKHHSEALQELLAIGTPQAAKALVPMLWCSVQALATDAALCLGALLSRQEVKQVLRWCPLKKEHKDAPKYEWVWRPFNEPVNSSLPFIAGRIAYLIDRNISDLKEAFPLEERLIIPLIVQARNNHSPQREEIYSSVQDVNYEIARFINESTDKEIEARLDSIKQSLHIEKKSRVDSLLALLNQKMQYDLLYRFENVFEPSTDDWMSINNPVKFSFPESWHKVAIAILINLLSLAAATELVLTIVHSPVKVSWLNGLYVFFVLSMLPSNFMLWILDEPSDIRHVVFGPYHIRVNPLVGNTEPWEYLVKPLALISVYIFTPTALFFGVRFMLRALSFVEVAFVWLMLIFALTLLYRIALRKDRAARNPLRDILKNKKEAGSRFMRPDTFGVHKDIESRP